MSAKRVWVEGLSESWAAATSGCQTPQEAHPADHLLQTDQAAQDLVEQAGLAAPGLAQQPGQAVGNEVMAQASPGTLPKAHLHEECPRWCNHPLGRLSVSDTATLPHGRLLHQGHCSSRRASGGASGLATLEGGIVHRHNDLVVRTTWKGP